MSNISNRQIVIGSITVFSGVVVLWLLTPFFTGLAFKEISERGQFGDLFGSINALFSGLAFAGVIVALFLQREELRLQRQELAATRQELARSADAQEALKNAYREGTHASSFRAAYEVLQAPSTREARGIVLNELSKIPFENWRGQEWDIRLKGAAELVCTTYDIVGIWSNEDRLLPEEFITDSWGNSLQESWKILEPLVIKYRHDRKAPEFWDDFERLANRAKKIKETRDIPLDARSSF